MKIDDEKKPYPTTDFQCIRRGLSSDPIRIFFCLHIFFLQFDEIFSPLSSAFSNLFSLNRKLSLKI